MTASKQSNQAVSFALSAIGTAVVVDDVLDYDGPYYECDASVRSECCIPIFGSSGELTGIIDAEAFRPRVFDERAIGILSSACLAIPTLDALYQ